MDEIRGVLSREIRRSGLPVPPDLVSALAPAICCLQEWRDCWLDIPGADSLRVGRERLAPVRGCLFKLRFENYLGLARVQPYADGAPLCAPVVVEVISPKFASACEHIGFFRGLLEDLFARAAQLPFDLSGPTERGVREALQPPTPLFVLHFLSQHADSLRDALALVQARPHRYLADRTEQAGLAQASQADPDVLQDIVRSPERWVRTDRDVLVARRMDGYAPTAIRQGISVESLDTPENRFVRHFLRQVLVAAEELLAQRWWDRVPVARRKRVRGVTEGVRRAYDHPMFDDVGPIRYLPVSSQVLLRRDGYRKLLDLWQRFHCARRPLFARLQEAIEVRDIATLYEVWAFFALIDEIQLALGETPCVEIETSVEHGLRWRARARFGNSGTLVYDLGYRRQSYSVSLRPDFSWVRGARLDVVLDAKFRLDRLPSPEEEDSPQATAKRADLYKMHTYRDALGVRAAVAVYPGTEDVFYHRKPGTSPSVTLQQLLLGQVSGVGAIAMKPFRDRSI